MRKTIFALALVGLAGCATPSVDDRLQHEPNYTLTSTKSAEGVSNCMESAWIVKYPARRVRIADGIRLVHGGAAAVEQVFDITNTANGSVVKAYIRTPNGYWAPKLMEDVRSCL